MQHVRTFTTDKVNAQEPPKKDKAVINKEYEELFNYMRENSVYKCGNLVDMPSRFGFFKRWRLEKQLNYNNHKHPIFLYAYRAFIDALAH